MFNFIELYNTFESEKEKQPISVTTLLTVPLTNQIGKVLQLPAQAVNKEVSPGGIIVEHCFAGRPGELNGTLQALPHIIDNLRAQGYKFVTVPTLLGQ